MSEKNNNNQPLQFNLHTDKDGNNSNYFNGYEGNDVSEWKFIRS